VRDQDWFFDTELLIVAQRSGMRIHEVAVDWIDDPDSSVDILATALADLRGVARLMWEGRVLASLCATVARFVGVSTRLFASARTARRRALPPLSTQGR